MKRAMKQVDLKSLQLRIQLITIDDIPFGGNPQTLRVSSAERETLKSFKINKMRSTNINMLKAY